jgi:hypothetical protein
MNHTLFNTKGDKMETKISLLHRGLLWLATITGAVFGLAYYFVPGPATTALGIDAPDQLAIRTIGGFLLGEALGAWFALRSGQWGEVRIVTLYLITWNILNSLTLFYGILFAGQSSALLPNTILTAILGFGLAFVYFQRNSSKTGKG